tara:strand:- start:871 stop:1083 length:213 start_codon:yes stop_codon:yes gene_type:complete
MRYVGEINRKALEREGVELEDNHVYALVSNQGMEVKIDRGRKILDRVKELESQNLVGLIEGPLAHVVGEQ